MVKPEKFDNLRLPIYSTLINSKLIMFPEFGQTFKDKLTKVSEDLQVHITFSTVFALLPNYYLKCDPF